MTKFRLPGQRDLFLQMLVMDFLFRSFLPGKVNLDDSVHKKSGPYLGSSSFSMTRNDS